MLRPRIIPCLLLQNGGLVKTRQFTDPTYVGDPLNTVRIFNEKEVDEILVLDIEASRKGLEPNYELISQIAAECRMPLTYGGGIKHVEHVERIVSLGVEKVAISSEAVYNPDIVTAAANKVGSQSVSAVLDVRICSNHEYSVFTHNGINSTNQRPEELASKLESAGAGELVINSIDRDGVGNGYDIELVAKIRNACNIPITVLGGAGCIEDIKKLILNYPVIGASAGSLFVFRGKYRAVLINYPDNKIKNSLINTCYSEPANPLKRTKRN